MRRLSLIGAIGLLLLLGSMSVAQASQSTQTGLSVTFYERPTTASTGDQLNPAIPDGQIAYSVTNQTSKRHPTQSASWGAWLQAVQHGRLPQTGTYGVIYLRLLGSLLLVATLLIVVIYRQVRHLNR